MARTDNGPQFASYEFAEFIKGYGFVHQTSSSYYPRSNGMAENGVNRAKRLLNKTVATGKDPYLPLLNYRAAHWKTGNPLLKCCTVDGRSQ